MSPISAEDMLLRITDNGFDLDFRFCCCNKGCAIPIPGLRFRAHIDVAMDTLPSIPLSLRSAVAYSLMLAWLSFSNPATAQDTGIVTGRSVFGANSYLSDGATALTLGNYKRGVELTRMGLSDLLSQEERAASLSNLCAGYVGLKEYEVAVVYCNRSLDIEPMNWRALQNRAAANAGLGNFPQALKDVELGLTLNPNSDALKLTLVIVRDQGRRTRPATPPPAPPARPPARS